MNYNGINYCVPTFNTVELILENVECISFPIEDIKHLDIEKISFSITKPVNSKRMGIQNDCEAFSIIISPNANVMENYTECNYEDLKPFDRLLKFKDIVAVRTTNKSQDIECYVPYDGEEENIYQHSYVNENGEMVIIIAKDVKGELE